MAYTTTKRKEGQKMIELKYYLKKHKVKSIIDIGAHIGEYAKLMWDIDPDFNIFSIEANEMCKNDLLSVNKNSIISCVSDIETTKTFYQRKTNYICTGCSIYRENTQHYSDDVIVTTDIPTQTLDMILKTYQENVVFDFLKMDTQGSELDILKGATNTIDNIKLIQAETDVSGYNIGVPSQGIVIAFLKERGFELIGVLDQVVWDGKLLQEDLLFEKLI